MPRIDPTLLLNTLSVLLSPNGGIKESEDVQRVVNLMTKFSKKLISKCVYIRILMATEPKLLDSFYEQGGWQLVVGWFTGACERHNWPLVAALLALLRVSPVTAARLGANSCRQQVTALAASATDPDVQVSAGQVVAAWKKIVSEQTVFNDQDQKADHNSAVTTQQQHSGGNKWQLEVRDSVVVFKKLDKYAAPATGAPATDAPAADAPATVVGGDDVQETKPAAAAEADANGVCADGKTAEDDTTASTTSAVKDEHQRSVGASHKESKRKKRDHSTASSSDGQSSRAAKRRDSSGGGNGISSSDKHRSLRRSSKESSSHRHKDSSGSNSSSSRSSSHKSSSGGGDRQKERERRRRREQEERARQTLATVCGGGSGAAVARLGAIPKKSSSASAGESTTEVSANKKKEAAAAASSEPRRTTVKTFRAKFRSTGLETEQSTAAKSRSTSSSSTTASAATAAATNASSSRPRPALPSVSSLNSSGGGAGGGAKRVLSDNSSAADKRSRLEQRQPTQRPGGVKLTSPKPIQEATGFMDALNASKADAPKKRSGKRTRRLSSRDDKDTNGSSTSTTSTTLTSPSVAGALSVSMPATSSKEKQDSTTCVIRTTSPATSPVVAKPVLKFYQETQAEKPADSEDVEEPAPIDDADQEHAEETAPPPTTIPLERRESVDTDSTATAADAVTAGRASTGGVPGGVLVLHRSTTAKKRSVTWRPDNQLVDVCYFDLDQNERVNVNRAKFEVMQAMDKLRERDFLRRARMSRDDGMVAQMAWRSPALVERPTSLADFGVNSVEKTTQMAREQSTMAYPYDPSCLPDSAMEPDMERIDSSQTRTIPLDSLQADMANSVKDYRAEGWPAPVTNHEPNTVPGHAHHPVGALPFVEQPTNEIAPNGMQQQPPPAFMHPLPSAPHHQQPPHVMPPWQGHVPPAMMPPHQPMMQQPQAMPLPHVAGPVVGGGGGWMQHPPRGFRPPPMPRGGVAGAPFPPQIARAGLPMMPPGGPPRPMRHPMMGRGFRGGRGGGGGVSAGDMWKREVPCKHYMVGHCRNGRMCLFLHPGVNNPPPPPQQPQPQQCEMPPFSQHQQTAVCADAPAAATAAAAESGGEFV